jgi:hypothetical protein
MIPIRDPFPFGRAVEARAYPIRQVVITGRG